MARVYSLQEVQALEDGQLKSLAYNTLDCTGTREIADVLQKQLDKDKRVARTYAFEKQLQAPAMSMMMRGVRVNRGLRRGMIKELKQELKKDEAHIARLPEVAEQWDGAELETGICPADFGKRHKWPRGVPDTPERRCEKCGVSRIKPKPFNANSPDQTHHLMYDLLKLPPLENKKGDVSTDDDVLQRIKRKYPQYAALVDAILDIRDKDKQLGSLSAKLTSNGRYPSTFNIGAAWTGRQSSSKNPFKLGGNLQNVAPRHRSIFIPDPGMDMGYADYKQGESNIVAHLSGDPKYIEAHRGGDVHTYVTRYVWPDLPWTGDLGRDKKIAKQLPPWDNVEGHDYRFQCKRIQHGSNYGLTPAGIHMLFPDIPMAQAKTAWNRYMSEFDYIPAWQDHMRGQVEGHQLIINPLGRCWLPFGRPWDKSTWRQALSFLPQSLLADICNIAMWRVWYYLEEELVQLLAMVHDALLHQFPAGELALERKLLQYMKVPVPVTDFRGTTRLMTIEVEAATGKNWGHRNKDNPSGIDEGPIEAYLKEHPL